MTAPALRLGTRKSPMAMFQSRQVASMITERTGRAVELVGITTFGDVSRAQLAQIGGTGVFVSGLRACLLAGQVDFAVHSLKDLPAGPAEGIVLAAVPPRDDPRDALAARDGAKLADLPPAARIGTGSPRRAAQLLLLRPDLRPVPVRGNAGTRLSRVESGEVDAVVLAYAGLARIGRLEAVIETYLWLAGWNQLPPVDRHGHGAFEDCPEREAPCGCDAAASCLRGECAACWRVACVHGFGMDDSTAAGADARLGLLERQPAGGGKARMDGVQSPGRPLDQDGVSE